MIEISKRRAVLGRVSMHTSTAASSEAVELAWTANAYLDSAEQLCEWIIENEYERSRHHHLVPLHLAYLGLELYFKAALAAVNGSYPRHHDLVELRKLYDVALPNDRLPIPSFIETLLPLPIGELFPDDPAPSAAWQFTRFRYFADSSGRPFPPLERADVQRLKDEISELHVAGLKVLATVGGWK
jgi:hypothetical protein